MREHYFGSASLAKLATADPVLVGFAHLLLNATPFDLTIVYGHRGKADQDAAFASGASKLRWPNSAHNTQPARAIDVAPFVGGKIPWDDSVPANNELWLDMGQIALDIIAQKRFPIFWGYKKWGWDKPHFQLE